MNAAVVPFAPLTEAELQVRKERVGADFARYELYPRTLVTHIGDQSARAKTSRRRTAAKFAEEYIALDQAVAVRIWGQDAIA